MLIKRQMEIIETYWNVNELKAAREEAAVARNNRNILECKLWRIAKNATPSPEIIETYWNVNSGRIIYCL